MRGTENEDAVLTALSALPFVENVFEAGLFSRKEDSYLACSPDGMDFMKKTPLMRWKSAGGADNASGGSENPFLLATVKIKICVFASLISQSITLSNSQPVQ